MQNTGVFLDFSADYNLLHQIKIVWTKSCWGKLLLWKRQNKIDRCVFCIPSKVQLRQVQPNLIFTNSVLQKSNRLKCISRRFCGNLYALTTCLDRKWGRLQQRLSKPPHLGCKWAKYFTRQEVKLFSKKCRFFGENIFSSPQKSFFPKKAFFYCHRIFLWQRDPIAW